MAGTTMTNDVLNMLVKLTQITQKLDQLSNASPQTGPTGVTPFASEAAAAPVAERSPRTLEELLVGLTERLEQFASQAEERGRRMDARLERIEKLLAANLEADPG